MKKIAPAITGGIGYLWAFFTGEGAGAEAVSIALSKGNDALNWYTLNNGEPVIRSQQGEQGLRDPFILRAKDGKSFIMIATDLKIHERPGNSFGTAQMNGSHHIEIFESADLVNWEKQRHVAIAPEFAGNTWAPKAFWDEASQQYIVFWAANLYQEKDAEKRTAVTYNRMLYVTTKDFHTFSQPEIWVDVDQGPGKGTIDATIVKEGDWYYRFMKEEATMTIRLDRTKNLFATVIGNDYAPFDAPETAWCTIAQQVGTGLPNGEGRNFTNGEGPCVFPANEDDCNGYRWFLFIDQPGYHDGPNHYVGFATNDLADPNGWVPVSDKLREGLPENTKGEKPRHGSVIPLHAEEYQRVYKAFLK